MPSNWFRRLGDGVNDFIYETAPLHGVLPTPGHMYLSPGLHHCHAGVIGARGRFSGSDYESKSRVSFNFCESTMGVTVYSLVHNDFWLCATLQAKAKKSGRLPTDDS